MKGSYIKLCPFMNSLFIILPIKMLDYNYYIQLGHANSMQGQPYVLGYYKPYTKNSVIFFHLQIWLSSLV